MKRLCLIGILSLVSTCIFAQEPASEKPIHIKQKRKHIRKGPIETITVNAQLGHAWSMKTLEYSFLNQDQDLIHVKRNDISSMFFGLSGQLILKQGFFFQGGLQFVQAGLQEHYKLKGRVAWHGDSPYFDPYPEDQFIQQKYGKLSIPISAGYQFGAGLVRPGLFIGFVPNVFTSASYYHQTFYHPDLKKEQQEAERSFNPLQDPQGKMGRLGMQVEMGCQVSVGNRFFLSFVYRHGGKVQYAGQVDQVWGARPETFRNSEKRIGLSYALYSSQTKKKEKSQDSM